MATRPRDRRYEIVPMTEADIDDVLAIEQRASRSPWTRQVFVEELERAWARVELLRERRPGAPPLGFINYWLVRDEVHVLNLAVDPDARRQGHASRLMEHAIGYAHRQRCRYLTLEVRRSNAGAIRLYRKYGFRPVGVRPNYYLEDREDALVMLLEL
jgi:ribosomal-protein-alanine N-acetyltransferase